MDNADIVALRWNRAEAEPLGYWLFFLDRAPTQVTEGVLGVRTAEFVIHPNDGFPRVE